ncbi:hypothetical protein GCM10027517_03780 [Phycicoccus ginsengisoli]
MSQSITTDPTERVTLRRSEAARRYGVSAWFIDRLIREGTLSAHKVGRVVLIDFASAESVLGGGR